MCLIDGYCSKESEIWGMWLFAHLLNFVVLFVGTKIPLEKIKIRFSAYFTTTFAKIGMR